MLTTLLSLALAAPVTVPVQGALVGVDGAPISGARQVTFRLYDDAAGGVAHRTWFETKTVEVQAGAFATVLGDTQTLDTALLSPTTLFLSVTIADGAESELAPVGFAARAGFAEDSRRVGGQTLAELDARYVDVQSPGSTPQTGGFDLAGSARVSGTFTAGSFVGGGAGVTGVDAASVGGMSLTQLDARFAAASGGSGYVRNQGVGTPQTGGFDLSGSARVSGTFTAGSFVGGGAGITGVDAASVGGQTLSMLDTRFVGASDSRLTNARAPTAGSASYVQNNAPGGTAQAGAGFNVDGAGRVGGTMTAAGGFIGSGAQVTGVDAAKIATYSLPQLYHGMMHAAASAACRSVGASTGCCGNAVVAGGGGTSCATRCAALSSRFGGRSVSCDAAVTIGTKFSVPSEGEIVAAYYNYGCGGSGGNAGSPIGLANPSFGSESYLEYCCCRAN